MEGTRMRIVVGVTGGIAAYKTAILVRLLRKAGHEAIVVPTHAALDMVGKTTWEALSGNPVHVDVTEAADAVTHVRTGQEADLIVIAPATANTMAKLAYGMADNLLTATVLVATCPVLLAPAMHTEMWANAATQANAQTLKDRGFELIGPASGQLTGKDSGLGRMVEPDEIAERVLARLAELSDGTTEFGVASEPTQLTAVGNLTGKSVVISAGGTHEPIDPVRFIGNASTGRMGVELANAAARQGATVTLVAANVERAVLADLTDGVEVVRVGTALELKAAMEERSDADVLVMTAAVADYRPKALDSKFKRGGAAPELTLVENPDILAGLAAEKRPGQIVVGFAAETGDSDASYLEHGIAKAKRKGADLIAVNKVGTAAGFGDVQTELTFVGSDGTVRGLATGSKAIVAAALVNEIFKLTTGGAL